MSEQPPLLVLLGPTAVGKTRVSIHLAQMLEGEIVSADSRSIYRGMDIGTDKPTIEDRARIPHHLIDIADPDEVYSLAMFKRAALNAIKDIHQRGRLPILVGGTGQYITAILEGWLPPPVAEDPAIREELMTFAEEYGAEALHKRLAEVDAVAAASIDHRNIRRVVRALEIYQITGTKPSLLREKHPPPFRVLKVGLTLPRTELFARIDERIETMLSAGLLEEVKDLLARGLEPERSSMTAIGYRQIADYQTGKISLEEAVDRVRRQTRQFVRRQANWFKADDPSIHWFDAYEGVEAEIATLVLAWLEEGDGRG